MRKVIVSNLMTLDGFMAGPDGDIDWFVVDEEFDGYARELFASVDTLLLGSVSGEGEGCEDGNGYCVWMEGAGHRARLVGPTCVQITPGDRWRAVHHRVDDRWTDVEIEPASDAPERYDFSSGRFVPGSC